MAKLDVEKIAAEIGLSADEKAVLSQSLANEKVSKYLEEATMMRADYSRSQDALAKEKGEMQRWYQTAAEQFSVAEAWFKQQQDTLTRYREQYGDLDNAGGDRGARPNGAPPAGEYMSKKDYEAAVSNLQQQTLYVIKEATRAAADYYHRFKEPLDVDALEKYAIEHKLPLAEAYKSYIAPKLSETERTQWEAKVKAAREEGERDALSKAGIPAPAVSSSPHPFFDRKTGDAAASAQPRAGFIEDWNKAATQP